MNMAKKKSSPPTHLTESELIAKMEQYAIGTDASIPTHVQNISDRGYISEGRKLVPTQLGIALVKAFRELDQDLVLPTVRAEVERSLSRIAKGEADHDTVRDEILNLYKEKFLKLTSRFYTVGHTFQGCFPPRGAYEPPALDHRPKAGSSKQNVSTGGSKRTKATSKSEIDNKRTKKIPSLMSVKPSAFASTCAQPYFNPRRPTNDTETNAANKRKLPAEAPSSNKRQNDNSVVYNDEEAPFPIRALRDAKLKLIRPLSRSLSENRDIVGWERLGWGWK
ncbi:DNA topoisomerase domain-containing protein [Ditylenchus destructor]|uniref:DNA topoisomerase n=1 Tax=Ditylenchus destructor TaxID=166010 RepID=A0AAD4MTN2_9BILA|nr:DNA topoisomerase domain-containing protein [Ditylenchus destructor]